MGNRSSYAQCLASLLAVVTVAAARLLIAAVARIVAALAARP